MACIEDRAFFIGHCILCRCHDTSRIHAAISQLSDKKQTHVLRPVQLVLVLDGCSPSRYVEFMEQS